MWHCDIGKITQIFKLSEIIGTKLRAYFTFGFARNGSDSVSGSNLETNSFPSLVVAVQMKQR